MLRMRRTFFSLLLSDNPSSKDIQYLAQRASVCLFFEQNKQLHSLCHQNIAVRSEKGCDQRELFECYCLANSSGLRRLGRQESCLFTQTHFDAQRNFVLCACRRHVWVVLCWAEKEQLKLELISPIVETKRVWPFYSAYANFTHKLVATKLRYQVHDQHFLYITSVFKIKFE